MLADLLMTFGKGFADQLAYWAHTYLPFGRWRKPTDEVIARLSENAAVYGISSAAVDRRRAYQIARVSVPNRHGEHLADLTPDAFNQLSPTCCAKSHSGKKKIASPDERWQQYLAHPQTLAYALTPAALCRAGVGGSAPGTVCGVPVGEATPPGEDISRAIAENLGIKGGTALDAYGKIVATLHAGPPKQEEEPVAA